MGKLDWQQLLQGDRGVQDSKLDREEICVRCGCSWCICCNGTDVAFFNGKDVGKCGKIDWSHVALESCLHLEFRRLVLHCWIRVTFCNLQEMID